MSPVSRVSVQDISTSGAVSHTLPVFVVCAGEVSPHLCRPDLFCSLHKFWNSTLRKYLHSTPTIDPGQNLWRVMWCETFSPAILHFYLVHFFFKIYFPALILFIFIRRVARDDCCSSDHRFDQSSKFERGHLFLLGCGGITKIECMPKLSWFYHIRIFCPYLDSPLA